MNPTQLGAKLQIDPKDIRKFARKAFQKPEGKWNFNQIQIDRISHYFSNQAPQVTQTVAAPIKPGSKYITVSEMTEIAKEFLKDTYDMELAIPIEINTRIKKTLGRFRHYRGTARRSVKIEIGKELILHHPQEVVIDVLKHELVHYALYEQSRAHRDGDYDFENELKKHGISRTHTFKSKGERHSYKCSKCNQTVAITTRRINTNNKISGCCRNHIIYIGKVTL